LFFTAGNVEEIWLNLTNSFKYSRVLVFVPSNSASPTEFTYYPLNMYYFDPGKIPSSVASDECGLAVRQPGAAKKPDVGGLSQPGAV
jgi:hypothetical protein